MKTIPKQKRIKVYKRALQIIEDEQTVFGLENNSLCYILQCIVFNYFHNTQVDKYKHTTSLFPEFGKYIQYTNNGNWHPIFVKFPEAYRNNRDLWRRVVLRLILEELKANEEY
jgi:hypothetical protein